MKKFKKAIALKLVMLLALNLPLGIEAHNSCQISDPKLAPYINSISVDEELTQLLTQLDVETDYSTFSKAINELYPNAVILDKEALSKLASVKDIQEMILEKSEGKIKTVEQVMIDEAYLRHLITLGKSSIGDIYVIINYDSITNNLIESVASFCEHCVCWVVLRVIVKSLGYAINPVLMFLIEYIVSEYFCPLCLALINSVQDEIYVMPVPICGNCGQYFSWVNQNWYCYNCLVWD